MHSAEWFSLLYKKPPLFLPREKIEEAGKGYRLSLEAPGVYDGNGLPCRVSVARMPLIDETFRGKNSMACLGVSDVKMTTPSCASNVLHPPRTSMAVLRLFSITLRLLATPLRFGRSVLIRQT